jgi:hypothetical protein
MPPVAPVDASHRRPLHCPQPEITHGRGCGAVANVPLRTSQRYRRGDGGCVAPLGDLRTSETSALMKEPAKYALPNSVIPTASTRQTTQPMTSRLDNPSNMELAPV